ncbi:MAG: porin family protein [Bradyrhizobium sp.]|nr:porin family protein [Bradyrhizobium sp.]
MRILLAVLIAVSVFHGADSALAADLPAQTYTKAPVVAPPVYNWTGFYIGGEVGGRWSDSTWRTDALLTPNGPIGNRTGDIPAGFDSSSVRAGGYVGYNWQVSPAFVLGIEGDAAWGDNNKSRLGIPGTWSPGTPLAFLQPDSSSVSLGWDAAVRARLGWLVAPNVMLFAAGGAAWQDVTVGASCQNTGSWCSIARNVSFNTTKSGWTVGGGVEAKVWTNWLARVEYRYSDFGSTAYAFFPSTIDAVYMHHDLKTQIVSFGLAYQFGGGPVVAKY